MVKKTCMSLKTLSWLLAVGLVLSANFPASAKPHNSQSSQPETSSQGRPRPTNVRRSRLKFKLPNIRGSRNLEAGTPAGVSERCRSTIVKALLPTTNIGLTVSPSPDFFVYLAQTSASQAEFILIDPETDELLYQETFSIPQASGVVSFGLPEKVNASKLQVGKTYHWYFAVKCVPGESSMDVITGGNIQRVEAPSSLVQGLKKALPTERPILYANDGMWFDALKSLADLRAANPNNLDLAADWKALLQEAELKPAELNSIAQAPVFPLRTQ